MSKEEKMKKDREERGFSYVCAKCGKLVDFEGNHYESD